MMVRSPKDDANLVSGDTVYNAIEDAKNAIDTDMDTKVSNKADIDASNVGKNLKGDDGSTAASDDAIQQNLNAWGSALVRAPLIKIMASL